MTHHVDVARGRDIVSRWCNLAEQRLDYLTELFETGRWRRFHTEHAFLENIREAKDAVELWRKLETREASLDNTAVDLSWLGRGAPVQHHGERLRERVPLYQRPAPIPAEPPREIPGDVLAALESVLTDSAEAPSVPDAPALDDLAPPTLDLDVIQQRYPLLRNAL
ncbi:TIGR03809 family protein [Bradyrhizobium sp. LjRoot220]|uniref:TIGR03809 family protein n=1 Tax=Bradyrhizobium sp. LjRoot220 TaxID=3342284 RepID=UPI003ED094D9